MYIWSLLGVAALCECATAIDFPMNVESDQKDLNGIPLDPQWRLQRAPGGGNNVGDRSLCGLSWTGTSIAQVNPPCTNQPLHANLFHGLHVCKPPVNPEDCLCTDPRGGGLDGHANWMPITMHGKLKFVEFSNDLFEDHDYNILITPDNGGLRMTGWDSLKIEFSSIETVVNYNGPLWLDFRDTPQIVDNHAGILTGMFGIDCIHIPEIPEIHPAFAFSANLASDTACRLFPLGPTCVVDKYMIFVRSQGNEGECSSGQEFLSIPLQQGFKVSYPWNGPKDVGLIAVVNTEVHLLDGSSASIPGGVRDITPVQGKSIDVTYDLLPGGLSVEGDVTFVYGAGPVFTLERQYTRQGGWTDTGRFISGDFTGDGLPDTAFIFNDDDQISIDVHVNNGDGTFHLERWASRVGGWTDTGKFVAGDFDGDGRLDIAFAFNDDDEISIDVHANKGRSFDGPERWANRLGGWLDGGRFIAADFTGDGRPDIAFIFNADGQIAIDVHPNNCIDATHCTRSFGLQRWSSGAGDWADSGQFLAADFTGDGYQDIAFVFNDDAFISIDIHPNTKQGAFGPQERWSNKKGGWVEDGQFLPGDFNGDGRQDIAFIFMDKHNAVLEVIPPRLRSFPARISIDIHANAMDPIIPTSPAFAGPERWGKALGSWSDNMRFMPGDFNGDGALDIAVAFNTDGEISQDLHRNLNVVARGQSPATKLWVAGESYKIGDQVLFNGILYKCQQAHRSQVGWEPPNTPALWIRPTPEGLSTWAPQTLYKVGSRVRFGGSIYECLQGHESLAGWEPPNTPALWSLKAT